MVPGVAIARFQLDRCVVRVPARGSCGENERAVGLTDGFDDIDIAGAEKVNPARAGVARGNKNANGQPMLQAQVPRLQIGIPNVPFNGPDGVAKAAFEGRIGECWIGDADPGCEGRIGDGDNQRLLVV